MSVFRQICSALLISPSAIPTSSSVYVCTRACVFVSVCPSLHKRMFPGSYNSEKSSIWNRTFLIEWRQSRFFPPWTSFSKSNCWHFINSANISQTVRDGAYISRIWSHVFIIELRRCEMLYIVTMSYIFMVTQFEMLVSGKRCELPKNVLLWLL